MKNCLDGLFHANPWLIFFLFLSLLPQSGCGSDWATASHRISFLKNVGERIKASKEHIVPLTAEERKELSSAMRGPVREDFYYYGEPTEVWACYADRNNSFPLYLFNVKSDHLSEIDVAFDSEDNFAEGGGGKIENGELPYVHLPDPGLKQKIIERIDRSKSFIDVAVYSFTYGEIAEALGRAAKRGVRVRLIRYSFNQPEEKEQIKFLRQQEVRVEIRSGFDSVKGHEPDKFAIFDGEEAFKGSFGSYDWTNNPEHKNWENVQSEDEAKEDEAYDLNNWEKAWFTGDPKIVKNYRKEFEVLWADRPVHHDD